MTCFLALKPVRSSSFFLDQESNDFYFNGLEPVDERTFDLVFPVIEKSFAPLDSAYKTARHLAFIKPYSKFYVGFSQVLISSKETVNSLLIY